MPQIISVLAARYSALDYAYGTQFGGPPLTIQSGNGVVGAGSIVFISGTTETNGGSPMNPLSLLAPIAVGIGTNAETVTPTAVTPGNLSGSQSGTTVTATFANVHGSGEPVTSGTFGLQEAINIANANGSGEVVVTQAWYNAGGTVTMLAAAVLPANGSVDIVDIANGQTWALTGTSLTVIAAPVAMTSATVASQVGIVGTWTAVTEHVLVTYVTANGGETLASADYSFTATVSLAIGGSGPAAVAGIVGYRVYIGANATTSCFLVPVIAANGTVIQAGPLACFKIGTAFSVATATVSAATPPLVQSTAFGSVQPAPFASDNMAQSFQTVSGPFAVTGVVTAGTAIEAAKVQLPAAFLNNVNRTIRLEIDAIYTPVSTATLIPTLELHSVYNVTKITMWTVTTAATSGTTASNVRISITFSTAAIGVTGTLEVHGVMLYAGVTASAPAYLAAGDASQAASSTVDLTKQDAIVFTINSGTANLTQFQVRRMRVEVLQ